MVIYTQFKINLIFQGQQITDGVSLVRTAVSTAERSTTDDKETQVGESKGVEQDLAAESPQPE